MAVDGRAPVAVASDGGNQERRAVRRDVEIDCIRGLPFGSHASARRCKGGNGTNATRGENGIVDCICRSKWAGERLATSSSAKENDAMGVG